VTSKTIIIQKADDQYQLYWCVEGLDSERESLTEFFTELSLLNLRAKDLLNHWLEEEMKDGR